MRCERKILTKGQPSYREPAHDQQQTEQQSATDYPAALRVALHLEPGDELVYEIADQRVILTKAKTGDRADDPFRTFQEWSTEADAKACADL